MAERTGGAIINADSMQVYDVLRILTARPSLQDEARVPHHLYGHVPPDTAYSTGQWLRAASTMVDHLRRAGTMPIFVGGTGLYYKALTGGLSVMPDIPPDVRARLRTRLEAEGAEQLHRELLEKDPLAGEAMRPQDGQRIIRALEVLETSGRSLVSFQRVTGKAVIDPRRARKIVVLPERSVLHRQIEGRFQQMIEQGAVEEVKALMALDLPLDLPVMRAIGVSQLASMVKGDISRNEAIEQAQAATRQYAKRQMTWFRNQMDDTWQRMTAADQSFL